MNKLRLGLLSLLGILCAQFSANATFEGTPSCEPDYEYVIEDGTFYFENTSDCDGGTYCWYVDGILQVIAFEWDWTPSEPGTYEICLNLLEGSCSTWYCEDIVVSPEDCSACHFEVETHSCGDCLYIFSIDADYDAEVSWLISDGTLLNGEIIMHTFDEPGTYTVCATAISEGCPEGYSQCFTIEADCGDVTTCEGGSILAQEIEPCYTNFSVQGLDGITGIEWFVNGTFWGDGTILPYFNYGDEVISVEAIVFTEECPDGIALSLSFQAEECGAGCDEEYFIWSSLESECLVYLYAEGTTFDEVSFNWYVDGEYVTSEWELVLENLGAGDELHEVLLEVWSENCPEPFYVYQTIALGPCDGGCDDVFFINGQEESECSDVVWLDGPVDDFTTIQWYINGEYAGGEQYLLVENFSDVGDVFQIEAIVLTEGCPDTFYYTELLEIGSCTMDCEGEWYIFPYESDDCMTTLILEGSNISGIEVEWYVDGSLWGTEFSLNLINTTNEDFVYQVEAVVTIPGCDQVFTTFEEIVVPACFTMCDEYYIDFECWPGGYAAEFFIPGLDEDVQVEWYLAGDYYGLSHTLQVDVGEGSYDVLAVFETGFCPDGVELDGVFDMGECIPDCSDTFTIIEESDGCNNLLYVVGSTSDFMVDWFVNGDWAGSEEMLLLEGSPDGATDFWLEVYVYTPNCDEGYWFNYTVVLPPCEEEECISFEIEIALFEVPFLDGDFTWDVDIVDASTFQTIDQAEIEIDIESGTGSLAFCLPAGCYSAEIFYPSAEWASWIEDILLIGSDDQFTFYTGMSDVIEFGLGTECGFDSGIVEPMVALEAYPNPVSDGLLNLEITGDAELLEIRDLSGRVMEQIAQPGKRVQISTDKYSNGLYMVTVHGPSGLASRKVQVQR